MVNNAGIGRAGTIEETTLEDGQDVTRITLDGEMHGSRAALSPLTQSGGASSTSPPSTGSSADPERRPTRQRRAGSSTSPGRWRSTTRATASVSTAPVRASSGRRRPTRYWTRGSSTSSSAARHRRGASLGRRAGDVPRLRRGDVHHRCQHPRRRRVDGALRTQRRRPAAPLPCRRE